MADVVEYTGQEEFKMSNKEAIDKANEISRCGDYAISWENEDEYRRIQQILNMTLEDEMHDLLRSRRYSIMQQMKEALGLSSIRDSYLDSLMDCTSDYWRILK